MSFYHTLLSRLASEPDRRKFNLNSHEPLKLKGFWPCSSSWHGLWSRETQDQTHLAREAAWKEHMDYGMMGWETDDGSCSGLSLMVSVWESSTVVGYRNRLPIIVCQTFQASWKVVSWQMIFLSPSFFGGSSYTSHENHLFFQIQPRTLQVRVRIIISAIVPSSSQMNIILWANELQWHVYCIHMITHAILCIYITAPVIICVTTTHNCYRHYMLHIYITSWLDLDVQDFPSHQGRVIICWASVRSHSCPLKRWHWNDPRRRKAPRRRRHWRDETAITPDWKPR